MAEYINKQQLLEKAKEHLNSPFGAALIIAEIEKADGVEVAEIIHCAKCKFCNKGGFCFKNIGGVGYKKVFPTDYCRLTVRKKEKRKFIWS